LIKLQFMASSPFNIFSQKCSPDETLASLLEYIPEAKVSYHADGVWSEVTGSWKQGWLKKPLGIRVTHNPDYYAGPGWPVQLSGMQGYFGKFEGADKRPDILQYLAGVNFAVSFILDSEIGEKDPRPSLVFAMARQLEGVVFLPGRLFNADVKLLLEVAGECDSEAELPPSYTSPSLSSPADAESASEETQFDPPTNPPHPDRVVNRLRVMEALIQRGLMEREADDPTMETHRQEMLADLQRTTAWSEVEPWEVAALERGVGTLSEKETWQLPWLSEGAMVLAWGLGAGELPPYDQQVDPADVYAATDRIALHGEDSIALRPMEQLETLAFQMLAIHWRLRQFHLDHKAMDFLEFAPRAWCGPMDLTLARIQENDLEINGQPLSQSSEPNWICASGNMEERRKAIYWLLGHSPIYSETDTST
jgi:hypothetical protein